jgi:hypothetical protein
VVPVADLVELADGLAEHRLADEGQTTLRLVFVLVPEVFGYVEHLLELYLCAQLLGQHFLVGLEGVADYHQIWVAQHLCNAATLLLAPQRQQVEQVDKLLGGDL